MLVKKSDGIIHTNGKNCSVSEYPKFSESFGIATANIIGRYPEKGFCINHECEQIYILQKGDIEIFTENRSDNLEIGDAYYFDKNEKYYIESNGCEVLIINTPIWNSEQSEYLD